MSNSFALPLRRLLGLAHERDRRLLTREELSEQYRRELTKLTATGEISELVAEQIAIDMFEPEVGGTPRLLKEDSWQVYVEEQEALASIACDKSQRLR